MKKTLAILILLIGFNTQAQSIFDYDYVIVPEKFEFQNKEHQYQLNSLLRVHFQEEGFEVLMTSEQKPTNLAADLCLALKTKVEKVSAFLSSKFQIKLVNCHDEVIFKSKVGESRSKAYEDGYKEGIRDAFTSIQKLEEKKSIAHQETKEEADEKAKPIQNTTPKVAVTTEYKEFTTYKKDGEKYKLINQNDQYKLLQNDKKMADIIPDDDGGLRYKSKSLNGIARFTPQGDLIITYQDQDIGRQVEMTFYKVQE